MGVVDVSGQAARRRAVGVLLLLAVPAAPALAQVQPGTSTSGSAAQGAAAAPPGLSLGADVATVYDTNALRRSNMQPLNPNQHVDDFRYSPAATASYGRDTGRIALAVNGTAGYDFNQYNHYLNREHLTGTGSLTYRTGSSCHAVVDGNYSRQQSGTGASTDQIIGPNGGLADDTGIVIDNVQTATSFGGNIGCGSPGGRVSFGGGYSHSSFVNGAPTRKFADSNDDSFNANVGIGLFRPGQISLNGSYSTIGYPNRATGIAGFVIPPALLVTGVKTYQIGVSFSRPIGTRLSGTIGASYLSSDSGGGQPPYGAPAYNVGLTYAASSRLGFTLNGSRNASASTSAGAAFRIVDQILLTGHYSLGRSIKIEANAGFIQNMYQQPFAVPGEPLRSNQTTKTFGTSISYAPRPLYNVVLNVTQSSSTSDTNLINYSSTRVGLTVAVHI